MKYLGSKNRIKNDILPIILQDKEKFDYYLEPFCGSCSVIENVEGIKTIASDINPYLIAMFKGLNMDLVKPMEISKELYDIKRKDFNILKTIDLNKIQEFVSENIGILSIQQKIEFEQNIKYSFYDLFLIGWVGWMASFNGRFFDGGYSGKTNKRDYVDEQIRNTLKSVDKIGNINYLYSANYELLFDRMLRLNDTFLPEKCIIYCDPPYKNSKGYEYSKNFDYEKFYDYCRKLTEIGDKVFVSEYEMPDDFKCVWSKEVTNSLNTIKTYKPVEKLFTL